MPKRQKRRITKQTAGERHADSVRRALDDLVRFFRVGRDSFVHHEDRLPYGEVDALARAENFSAEKFRKARQFASAYGKSFWDIENQCRSAKFAMGPTHAVRLVAVPKAHRKSFVRDLIAGRWSLSKMDSEIRLRFGRARKGVGRKPRGFGSGREACYELIRQSETFQNLAAALTTPSSPIRSELPPKILSRLQKVEKVVAAFHKQLLDLLPDRPSKSSR